MVLLRMLILSGSIGWFASAAHAAEGELPFVVLAIRENAERLRSGEYHASGTYTVKSWDYSKEALEKQRLIHEGKYEWHFDHERFKIENYRRRKAEGDDKSSEKPDPKELKPPKREHPSRINVLVEEYAERLRSVFDFDKSLFSFRRTREKTAGNVTEYDRLRRAWFVSTPERTFLGRGSEKLEVTVRGPMSSPKEAGQYFAPVLDPRMMGWSDWDTLNRYFGLQFLGWSKPENMRVVDEGNGIRRLEAFLLNDENPKLPTIVLTWWCDEQQGFQPIRYTMSNRYLNPTTPNQKAYNSRSSQPRSESEFSWIKVSDVWVLKTLDTFDRKYRTDRHLQLTFDWVSVNEPVAASNFDRHAWKLPEGSRVVDVRMGADKPILVERVGKSMEAELPPPLKKAEWGTGRWILIVLNVIVLGFLAGLFIKRHRLKRNALS